MIIEEPKIEQRKFSATRTSQNEEISRNKENKAKSSVISTPRHPEESLSIIMSRYKNDFLYFESELLKYKTGISSQYIPRWCNITKTHFNYFKSNWGANCWLSNPLISVPLNCIDSISRVVIQTPKYASERKCSTNMYKRNKGLFQFEIFLKKEVDVSMIIKCNPNYLEKYVEKIELKGEGRNKKLSPLKVSGDSSDKLYPSHIESTYHTPQRTSQGKMRNSSSCITDQLITPGHLMRRPSVLCRTKVYTPDENQIISQDISTSIEKHVEDDNGMCFQNAQEHMGYHKFESTEKIRLKTITVTDDIHNKSPSGWIPSLSSIF